MLPTGMYDAPMRAGLLACVVAGLGVGCGPGHKPGSDDPNAVLTIGPPTSELEIVNGMPATEAFTATLTYPDGVADDVTADVKFAVDTSYGDFAASLLSMHSAGKVTVFGTWQDKVASAEVIARAKGIRVDPGLPANTPDLFGGPEDPSHAPAIVYPPLDVVMPRNLGDFEIHWTDASANDVFEVSLHTDYADIRVYVPGGNGLPAAGPDPSWTAFLAAEWTQAVGNENNVLYQVRGVQSSNPATVGAAVPRLVQLGNEQMLGGIYYWAAAGTTSPEGIFRHDMSKPGQPAQEYMTVAQTGGRCVACHVLSRDGTKMAITWDGGNQNGNMVNVETKALQTEANAWNFGTFTPDGNRFLSVHGGSLVVRDSATQAVLTTMASAGWVTHPDLSADGSRLVYARPTVPNCDWAFGGGQLFTRSFDPATLSFGPETPLVSNAKNNYYPSFSPDGQWIMFNQSDDNSTSGAYNNPSSTLWVVKADGSAPPVQLAKMNAAAGLTDSWGRWAPFAQTIGTAGEKIYWVTVSSKRAFGVRLQAGRPQVWMAAFHPDRATAQIDPTDPAFRLPFQNLDSNNHIAQWTEQVVGLQ